MKHTTLTRFFSSSLALAMTASLLTSSTVKADTFSDVATTDWFYPYVNDMAAQGLVSGNNGEYLPNNSLSVAEFSVMISNAFYGNTLVFEKEAGYSEWWECYISACYKRNGLSGTVAEDPSNWSQIAYNLISRYDMATMIFNLLGDRQVPLLSESEITAVLQGLNDTIPEEYETAVAMAFHYGFLSGKSGDIFDGTANLTRAEAAVVLSALVNSDFVSLENGDTGTQGQVGQGQGQMPEGELGQMGQGQMPEGEQGQMGQGQMPEGEQGQMGQGQMPEGEQGQMGQGQGQPPEGELGQMGQGQGQMPSGGTVGQTVSTYTVEEAKAIEAKLLAAVDYSAQVGGYPIVDTNQTLFYSNDALISAPSQGEAFYGQDGTYSGNQPSYTNNGDGTITDHVTGLTWQQDPGAKMTWGEAVDNLDAFNGAALGGYSDWRIPTIKELYSLVDFSGLTGQSSSTSIPYIDTDYFVFTYGDQAGEARFIDSQILSSTIYGSTTLGNNTTVFGYNFADGRIKGYEIDKDFYCYYVRGNTSYGMNLLVDNGNGTITDEATSLMWMQNDSGYYQGGDAGDGTMDWASALAWAEEMNAENFLGYSDWRLPNVKELQSLTDYSNSPMVTGSPAIDPLFYCTPIVNYFGEIDYGFYWTGTTHDDLSASATRYGAASYVIFGNSLGEMNGVTVDAHGAGSQRSDPKTGERDDYPAPDPNAPQGDEQRVFNMVRLVRDV